MPNRPSIYHVSVLGTVRAVLKQSGANPTGSFNVSLAGASTKLADTQANGGADITFNATKQRSDAAGRTLRSLDQLDNATVFTYDASGNQLSVRDPNNVGADMVYDQLGRNTSRTDTQGDVTSTIYDRAGNAIRQTDAKTKFTTIAFDARGRRKSTTDRISAVTSFTYRPGGQLLSLTDAENQTTSYTYDARGAKLTEQYPDHTGGTSPGNLGYGIVTFVYDNVGRVLRKHDQQGDTVTFNYDLAGRMSSRDFRLRVNSPSGTIADSDVFTYDRAGRMLTAYTGRYGNTVTNVYDSVGRKASEALQIAAQTYTVGINYNARGELIKYTYPDGSIVDRTYHATGNLHQVKLAGTTLDTRTYDAGGRMATSTYQNGVASTWTYRNDNLVTSLNSTSPGGTPTDGLVANLAYTWDANKNKLSEVLTGVNATVNGYGFNAVDTTYDFEDRLTQWKRANGAQNQSWSLTAVGDWQSQTVNGTATSRTHGPTHEMTAIGASSLSYDAKGNLTQDTSRSPTQNYVWDYDNKMKSADIDGNGSADVLFEYDALGRRVARTQGADAVVYFQVDQQTICDYPRGGAAASPTYRYFWGSYIDELIARKATGTGGAVLFAHRNQQYSIYAYSNSSGAVVERIAYTAYGQPTFMNAAGTVQSTSPNSIRYSYTGREWDASLQLHFYRTRWMGFHLGRFNTRDLFNYKPGPNLYIQEMGFSLVDWYGTCAEKCDVSSFKLKDKGCTSQQIDDDGDGKLDEWHFGPEFEVDAVFKEPCKCCSYRQFGCCDITVTLLKRDPNTKQDKIMQGPTTIDTCDTPPDFVGPGPAHMPEDCIDRINPTTGLQERRCYGHRNDPSEADDKYYADGCKYFMHDHAGVTYGNILKSIDRRLIVSFNIQCWFKLSIIDTCAGGTASQLFHAPHCKGEFKGGK